MSLLFSGRGSKFPSLILKFNNNNNISFSFSLLLLLRQQHQQQRQFSNINNKLQSAFNTGSKNNNGSKIAMLNRPIGDEKVPSTTDNTGIDNRTKQQKREDFTNYERHLARRKEL